MKSKRFKEEQINYALRPAEGGTPVGNVWPAARQELGGRLPLEVEVPEAWHDGDLGDVSAAR
jgi:hypothetical protein